MKNNLELLVKDVGEWALVQRIAKIIECRDPNVVVSIGDDAAVVRTDCGDLLALTTDILVEDIHFKTETHTASEIGYKAIVANVSDIAAMAGLPRYALVTLGVNPNTPVAFVEDLYDGMITAAEMYGLSLIGGDTTRSDGLILNVMVLGSVEEAKLKQRCEARLGEHIGVTGDLGSSAAGLFLLSDPALRSQRSGYSSVIRSHVSPKARLQEARVAAEQGISALEDISDGLASEVKHICEMSNLGAVIRAEDIPIAQQTVEVAHLARTSPQEFALFGGEDFELVFTAPAAEMEHIKEAIFAETGTKVAVVGETAPPEQGIRVLGTDGLLRELQGYGFQHF